MLQVIGWGLISAGVLILVILGYILLVRWEARRDTKNAPREDMVECHAGKHGPYPKKHAMEISDLGTEKPVLVCPLCYQEAAENAKRLWSRKE